MKLKMPRRYIKILLGVVFISGFWFFIGWIAKSRTISSDLELVESAYRLITRESLYNQKSPEEIAYAAVRGMLASIDDPYAELIEPEAAQDLIETFAGRTGVVGLYAENQDGQVVVQIVFPGGAAEEVGVQVGDVILSIDGTPLDEDSDSSETGLLIRGLPNTVTQLEILRGEQILSFEITRREREFVEYRMLPGEIGYIHLNAFNVTASQKMKQALEALMSLNPQALIWDLRNNEGGDMQAAQQIISYFIENGLLFSAQLTQEREVRFMAKGDAISPETPLVVLMDESTYSAAETAAAAILESGRGTTVGSSSYGKGLIQATLALKKDALLQITIAKWLSSNGEWYHERGVTPQIFVEDNPDTEIDEVLERAVEYIQTKR
jgi:carboxyl-terminal processing protease